MRTLTFKKMLYHLRTIRIHRKWVRHYCFLAGIPWRGIKHDISKYSPTEFFESARYWDGKSSPINRAKEEQGVSYAWMHHKGHNSHHYEYWMDNFDKGGVARLIPKNDFVEMVCDMLGASYTYTGNKDGKVNSRARQFWIDHLNRGCAININNATMLNIIFDDQCYCENYSYLLKDVYTSEELIKSGYLQQIWEANKGDYDD